MVLLSTEWWVKDEVAYGFMYKGYTNSIKTLDLKDQGFSFSHKSKQLRTETHFLIESGIQFIKHPFTFVVICRVNKIPPKPKYIRKLSLIDQVSLLQHLGYKTALISNNNARLGTAKNFLISIKEMEQTYTFTDDSSLVKRIKAKCPEFKD